MRDMPLVYACVVPHPPIIVPEVGQGREREVTATIQAARQVGEEMAQNRLETLLIVSPHGASYYQAMGALTSGGSSGTLGMWSPAAAHIAYEFANDLELAGLIQREGEAAGIPVEPLGATSYELDHGVMVPMYFLQEKVRDLPLVVLSFSWLPLQVHYEFGRALQRVIDGSGKRAAFIASGDLSHRLIPSAPAGYSPMGKLFDQKVVEALDKLDSQAILNLDKDMVEGAGECGLRSIAILLGLLEGLPVRAEVLSYEGPFGVGYPVATFRVEGYDSTG